MEWERGEENTSEEKEASKGHFMFYSYRPLAPSVGSNPDRQGLKSSPNCEEAGGCKERQKLNQDVKPYILYEATVVFLLLLCCPNLT